jgi:hypothetical protein
VRACVREIDDISDAGECSGGVVFSLFHFSFDETLNKFFEETTTFFLFFSRAGVALSSLSLLSFFSLLLWGFIIIARTHTRARARKKRRSF